MAAREILFNTNARNQIAHGLITLANAVKLTLGPRGRNALLEKSWGAPMTTRDGVTVAREIELDNRFTNIDAQMVKEVASRTSDVAGGGTTTASVLAQAMYAEGAKLVAAGAKLVAAGANPMDIKRAIDAAMDKVGKEGVIAIAEARSMETTLDFVEGKMSAAPPPSSGDPGQGPSLEPLRSPADQRGLDG